MTDIEQAPATAEQDIPPEERVAILDAGAQYGKVIDRRVRALNVRSDLFPLDTPYETLEGYSALIISGGPASVYEPGAPHPDPQIWQSGKPLLGICYGMQLINEAFGGTVGERLIREDGQMSITVNHGHSLFEGLTTTQQVLMSHGDSIAQLAPGFQTTAFSGEIIAAIANEKSQIYGTQFHPEVDATDQGMQILSNFLFGIATLEPTFQLKDRAQAAIDHIREMVRDRQVLIFASGGVDSTVCATLVGKALPADQIQTVHIDTGFMRHGESEAVTQALNLHGIDVASVDASEQFLQATTVLDGQETLPLYQTADPEIKRRIVGDTFIKVMERVLSELNLDVENTVLAQGTLRPDLIESASHLASDKASVIKTHHNDTQLVRDLRVAGRVIEPLQDLHKDEVRELGEQLGLPGELVWRQPFPGPGLAIRLLCAEKPYITKDFEAISHALQEFEDPDIAAHLLPVRTVGVQGDGRSYSYLVGLSGTTDWPRLLQKARDIPKQIHAVNRVVYVFGDTLTDPVKDITPTLPTVDAIEQLRQADHHVAHIFKKHNLERSFSQVPVVSFPVPFDQPGNRSIGIRAFKTNDFMTGTPAIPEVDIPKIALEEVIQGILSLEGISRVAYDLTSKPPATTEWE